MTGTPWVIRFPRYRNCSAQLARARSTRTKPWLCAKTTARNPRRSTATKSTPPEAKWSDTIKHSDHAPRRHSSQPQLHGILPQAATLMWSLCGRIATLSRKSRMSGRCLNWLAGTVVKSPTTRMPALIPASMPGRVSSKTRHSSGGLPPPAGSHKKPSGSGLPLRTSSTGTMTRGTGKPAATTRASASVLQAEVTIAHG